MRYTNQASETKWINQAKQQDGRQIKEVSVFQKPPKSSRTIEERIDVGMEQDE